MIAPTTFKLYLSVKSSSQLIPLRLPKIQKQGQQQLIHEGLYSKWPPFRCLHTSSFLFFPFLFSCFPFHSDFFYSLFSRLSLSLESQLIMRKESSWKEKNMVSTVSIMPGHKYYTKSFVVQFYSVQKCQRRSV